MYRIEQNYYYSDYYEFTLVFEENGKEEILAVSDKKHFMYYLETLLNKNYDQDFKMSLINR